MALLDVASVTKRFGGLTAVDAASFAVEEGAIHGLIGPNGSGKSTLFNLISGVLRPESGRIAFQGRDLVGTATARVVRLGIARTFQNIELFYDMTVLENCLVGTTPVTRAGVLGALLRPRWVQAEEAEARATAQDCLAFMGLDGLAGELARNVAYGHQRRLEIARALAARPKLMLLDEPAAGMNPTETRQLMGMIERLAGRGITVLLVEHNMKMVMDVCRRVSVLNYGRVIADGAPAAIQRDGAVIEAYLGRARR